MSSKTAAPRQPRPAADSTVSMTELVLPQHTNALGTAFGGTVMSWVDIAAAICAQRHCRAPVVTASIDAMDFLAPLYLGWIAQIHAQVSYTGSHSCEITVRISAEEPTTGKLHPTATAFVTMVATDRTRRLLPMPPLALGSDQERTAFEHARQRYLRRQDERQRRKV